MRPPERKPIGQIARGKWPSILSSLGVDERFLVNRHGPCPICAGKDRFRFDDKGDGLWYCNACGAGDGVALLMKVHGWEFVETAREIERVAGDAKKVFIRQGPDPAAVRKEMNAIWQAGKPLGQLDATYRWWERRIGAIPECPDLRGVAKLRCPNAGEFPAMVAIIRSIDGKPVNMHRTFLDALGDKANIPEPRRVMPLPLPKGSAVRLARYEKTLGIAEGIETAVAATRLFAVPCWAALTANNMADWTPPEGVTHVEIFADHDRSLTGHAAAYTLGKKLKAKSLSVTIHIPEKEGWDWNDEWLASRGEPA